MSCSCTWIAHAGFTTGDYASHVLNVKPPGSESRFIPTKDSLGNQICGCIVTLCNLWPCSCARFLQTVGIWNQWCNHQMKHPDAFRIWNLSVSKTLVMWFHMWFRCSWGKSFHTLHVGCHVAISRSVAQGTGPELVQDQLHSSKAMAKTLMPPPKHVPIKKKDSCMAAPHPYEVQRTLLKRTPIARLKRHAEYLLKGATCCLASAMSFFLFSSKMSIIPHKICFRHRVLLLLRGDSRSTYFGRLLGRICQ